MTDQPPDTKYVKPDEYVTTGTEKDAIPAEKKPKLYYVPNRHDRRRAAAIQRKEDRQKRKND